MAPKNPMHREKLDEILLDKGTNKRRWNLSYRLTGLPGENYGDILTRIINFGANTHEEACDRALKILKKSAKKAFWKRLCYEVRLFRSGLLPSEDFADNFYRLKFKYFDAKEVLKVKDPRDCFVRGYGPEATAELYEGFKSREYDRIYD